MKRQVGVLIVGLLAFIHQAGAAAEGLALSGNLDLGQILITCALGLIVWEARGLLRTVRKMDKRLTHMEAWAQARFKYQQRNEDLPQGESE